MTVRREGLKRHRPFIFKWFLNDLLFSSRPGIRNVQNRPIGPEYRHNTAQCAPKTAEGAPKGAPRGAQEGEPELIFGAFPFIQLHAANPATVPAQQYSRKQIEFKIRCSYSCV